MGTHARAVTPVTRPHDHQAFFGGFAHGDRHFDGTDARAFSRTDYAAALDRYDDAEPSVEVRRVNDAGARSHLAWRRYAELRGPSAEDERAVEETTEILTNLLVRVNGAAARIPGLTARLYGIRVHTEFAIAVKALKLPPHLRNLTLEVEQASTDQALRGTGSQRASGPMSFCATREELSSRSLMSKQGTQRCGLRQSGNIANTLR